jgi:hypothetical protein
VAFRTLEVFNFLLVLAMISSRAGILLWPRGFSELFDGGAGRSTCADLSSDRRLSWVNGRVSAAAAHAGTGRRRLQTLVSWLALEPGSL